MNKILKPFLGISFLGLILISSGAIAQDSSQIQWTVIDNPKQLPVSTVAGKDEAVSARAPDRQAEIEKALNGVNEKNIFKSPEITQESIELIFAPYHTQNKQDFLSRQEHTLADVIERAKTIHTQAKTAQEEIALAQRRVFLSIRQMFPEVTFDYNHKDGSISRLEYLSRSERLSLRQPLFRGGILWNSFMQDRKMLEAARGNYQKVIDDLVLEISKVYFEYQRARAVAEDQQKIIEVVKPQVEISEKKFKENITSEIEHLNAQSLEGQIEFDRETATQELEIAKLDLQHYLGLAMQDQINLKTEYDVDKVIAAMPEEELTAAKIESSLGSFSRGQPIPGLEKLVEMSYGHRAELGVRVLQLEQARYSERAKWGGLVPRADLVVEWGVLAEALKVSSTNPDHQSEFRAMLEVDWNAMGNKLNYAFENDRRAPSVTGYETGDGTMLGRHSFSIGLLSGLDALVDIKQAEVDKLNKVVELEQAEKKVLEEVKRAYYDYQKALIQMKSVMRRVQWRRRLRDLAQHRLTQKEVEVSDYLQSEIDLLKERGEFHRALKEYYTAKSSLNYAVGVREFLNERATYETK